MCVFFFLGNNLEQKPLYMYISSMALYYTNTSSSPSLPFSSPALFFGVRSSPMLPQWHVKDPSHSAKSAGGSLHLNTRTNTFDTSKLEWTDYAAVQPECGNLSGNELTCNSSGNTRLQSSQLAEPLWTDPGLKLESVCAS